MADPQTGYFIATGIFLKLYAAFPETTPSGNDLYFTEVDASLLVFVQFLNHCCPSKKPV